MTVPSANDPRLMTVKQEIMRAITALPDDAGYDEAFAVLHVLYKIHVGVSQAEAGLSVAHDEVIGRMAKWLK